VAALCLVKPKARGERSSAMIEMTPAQYRAEAERCRLLAEGAADPVRKVLYRQMERSYLTLAETQEILGRPVQKGPP
jgi:hypothetical protein